MMNPVKMFIKEMNKGLHIQQESQLEDRDNWDIPETISPHPPVTGVGTMQSYNSAMHYARRRGVQHHNSQLGLVTAALVGTYALPVKEK
jgi:hypothetical protein